ncbi:MAG: transglycosylase SLT domain-containing protein [Treponema sp.]|nr:transglycosylase SLT domain-containing protein [Treponema sp.]
MRYKGDNTEFLYMCRFTAILLCFITVVATCIYIFLPASKIIPFTPVSQTVTPREIIAVETDMPVEDVSYFSSSVRRGDDGLALYRQPSSRAAVEWFYMNETGNRNIAIAILEQADKNDIPLSLAFALAHTESRYNINAVNYNSNNSIDRGLFQLNSRSFPQLTEADFFNAATSAQYGMAHLRFCLNVAGNAVPALAMYNAGATRVRSNGTPQSTLNYIGNIMTYKQMLDKRFTNDVLSFYDTSLNMGASIAYQD